MDDDTARKISEIKTPSDNEAEIEEYENCVMEIKNKSVSLIKDRLIPLSSKFQY